MKDKVIVTQIIRLFGSCVFKTNEKLFCVLKIGFQSVFLLSKLVL